jgi:hypothetical protein
MGKMAVCEYEIERSRGDPSDKIIGEGEVTLGLCIKRLQTEYETRRFVTYSDETKTRDISHWYIDGGVVTVNTGRNLDFWHPNISLRHENFEGLVKLANVLRLKSPRRENLL